MKPRCCCSGSGPGEEVPRRGWWEADREKGERNVSLSRSRSRSKKLKKKSEARIYFSLPKTKKKKTLSPSLDSTPFDAPLSLRLGRRSDNYDARVLQACPRRRWSCARHVPEAIREREKGVVDVEIIDSASSQTCPRLLLRLVDLLRHAPRRHLRALLLGAGPGPSQAPLRRGWVRVDRGGCKKSELFEERG